MFEQYEKRLKTIYSTLGYTAESWQKGRERRAWLYCSCELRILFAENIKRNVEIKSPTELKLIMVMSFNFWFVVKTAQFNIPWRSANEIFQTTPA